MNKRIIIVVSILIIGILVVILFNTFGRKPFAKLSASEIVSAELFIIPPEKHRPERRRRYCRINGYFKRDCYISGR